MAASKTQLMCNKVILALLLAWSANGANIVRLGNVSGGTLTNYPVQLGRPFVQSEIANYPQIGQCATSACSSVTWLDTAHYQSDVKARWADTTVKHAIISFVVASLPTGSTYFTFRNSASANNTPIDKTAMLAGGFDFDAVTQVTFAGPTVVSTSARTMLNAHSGSIPDCETVNWSTATNTTMCYWLKGPINTTVVIADHSLARAYDFGIDANKSLRPVFEASFWPTTSQTRVRFAVENSSSIVLQDQSLSGGVALTIGSASPASVYTFGSVLQQAGSRWTRVGWNGGTPSDLVDIDYNMAYLVSTKALPNYNTTLPAISGSTITSQYSSWTGASKNIYDAGLWQTAMGTGGGRPDIGPFTAWHVRWMYTGDYRMRLMALGLSDLASAWGVSIREGTSGKTMATGVSNIGRMVSPFSRATTAFGVGCSSPCSGPNYGYSFTVAGDRVVTVGNTTVGTHNWLFDPAHLPEIWSESYLLTGDWYYLDTGLLWAGWLANYANGAATGQNYGRGATGKEGCLPPTELRAASWTFRNRVEMWSATPDAMNEKAALASLINDAIACEEGSHSITTGIFNGNAVWNWAHSFRRFNPELGGGATGLYSTLGQYTRGGTAFAQSGYGIDNSVTSEALSQFEDGFFTYATGRALDLGFAADKVLDFAGLWYVNAITDGTYNRFLLNSGREPTISVSPANTYFPTMGAAKGGYYTTIAACQAVDPACYVGQNIASWIVTDAEHGYAFIGMTAVSMLSSVTGGSTAWNTLVSDGLTTSTVLNDNPKWAILPRSTVPSGGGSVTINTRIMGTAVR